MPLSLIASTGFGQEIKMENDTVYYLSQKYAVGDVIKTNYGSDVSKNFAFISLGNGIIGITKLESGFSKQKMKITKIYKMQGKYYMKALFVDDKTGTPLGTKLFIDIEGAVDNKELVTDYHGGVAVKNPKFLDL